MTEKKYIDADSVIKDLRRIVAEPWNHNAAPASWADAYRQMIDILDDEPAADARPVKRGVWKKHYADHEAIGERPFCRYCSVCNTITVFRYNYCPNCGADMRKQDD